MKRGALTIGLLAATLATGCHTVLWTPDYGVDGLSDQAEERARFYNERYYGDYSFYYETPWWAGLSPTVVVAPERMEDARGDDGFGRDSQARESGGRYSDSWRSPATISSGSSGSQESGSTNSGDARTKSTNNNSRSSGGSSDKNVRKTDGGRSNDGGRR